MNKELMDTIQGLLHSGNLTPRGARVIQKLFDDNAAAIQRVRALHAPCVDENLHSGDECCRYCGVGPWPCSTILALDGCGDE